MSTFLGLLGVLVFIVAVIAVASAVTWTTAKLLPAEKPPKPDAE